MSERFEGIPDDLLDAVVDVLNDYEGDDLTDPARHVIALCKKAFATPAAPQGPVEVLVGAPNNVVEAVAGVLFRRFGLGVAELAAVTAEVIAAYRAGVPQGERRGDAGTLPSSQIPPQSGGDALNPECKLCCDRRYVLDRDNARGPLTRRPCPVCAEYVAKECGKCGGTRGLYKTMGCGSRPCPVRGKWHTDSTLGPPGTRDWRCSCPQCSSASAGRGRLGKGPADPPPVQPPEQAAPALETCERHTDCVAADVEAQKRTGDNADHGPMVKP